MYDAAHSVAARNRNFASSFAVGGQVLGEWTQQVSHNTLTLTLKPFAKLGRRERNALAVAAQKYGEFLGMSIVVA
jgi:hypothetical protein